MSNLKIEQIRQIENFTEDESGFPLVGHPAENHIDDNWVNDEIYKAEFYINLKDGKLYTSDGTNILHLNRTDNYVIDGLFITSPKLSGDGIALDVSITDGYAIIDNKLGSFTGDLYTSNPEVSDYRIDLSNSSVGNDKFVFLFAKLAQGTPFSVQNSNANGIEFVQHIVEGSNATSNFDELNLDTIGSSDIIYRMLNESNEELGLKTNEYDYTTNEHLLLSIIWIPSNYDETSYNKIEPISLSNKLSNQPIQESTHRKLLINKIDKIETWGKYKVFYKTQILKNQNNLYIVHKTFGTGYNDNISFYEIVNGNEDSSDSASETTSGFISKLGVDYSNNSNLTYWKKIEDVFSGSTVDSNELLSYIVGLVPTINSQTSELPEISINGVRATVGYDGSSALESHVYFVSIPPLFSEFDILNYSESDLAALQFETSKIKSGYILIWNEENIGYRYDPERHDIIMYYKE